MCSRKWDAPAMSSGSSREPMSIHSPTETDRTCGIDSVTRRSPVSGSDRSNGDEVLLVAVVLIGPLAVALTLEHRNQVQLAVRADLGDANAERIADLDDVLDALDALATGELSELRDVNEAVPARDDVHERAEVHRLHDLALVLLADLERLRVE